MIDYHKQFVLLLLCSAFLVTKGFAQDYYIEYLNSEDRLYNCCDGQIIKDENNYLWISDFRGLTRFDGRNFTTFHNGSSADIRVDFEDILFIYKLKNGKFAYFKKGAELGVFDPQTYQFRSVDFRKFTKKDAIIVSINEYNNGELYVCLESEWGISVIRYDGTDTEIILEQEERRLNAIKLQDFSRPKLFIAPFDDIHYVFYDANKGFFVWEETKNTFTPIVLPTTSSEKEIWPYFMTRSKIGEWLMSFTDIPGIFTFNESFEVISHTDFSQDVFYEKYHTDTLGNIVFKTREEDGVKKYFLYQVKNRAFTEVKIDLPIDHYSSIVWSDNYEHYFFIAGEKGLVYGRKPSYEITPFLNKAPKNKIGVSVRAMVELENKQVLIGSDFDGLFLYDPNHDTVTSVPVPAHWPDDLQTITFARTLLRDTLGSVLLTAYSNTSAKERPSGYLIRFDEKTMQLDSFLKISSRVESMCFINDTLILAGITSELLLIQLTPKLKVETLNDQNPHWPKWMELEKIIPLKKEGQFYILTNNGLYYYEHFGRKLRQIPLKGSFTEQYLDLYQENEQIIWIGTYGDGLYRYDLLNETLEHFNYQNGIKSDIICGVLPDGEHHLFLSSYDGLYRFDKRTGQASYYGLKHGLMHYEFNQLSFLALSDTSWLFGGMNGFCRVKKTEQKITKSKELILLSYVKLRNELTEKDTILFGPFDLEKGVVLPASARRLKLGISNFDPSKMDNKQLYCRLYPVSEHWELLPENGELSFSFMPPGYHELQVAFKPGGTPVFTLPVFAQWHFFELKMVQLLIAIIVIGFLIFLLYLYFDRKVIREKSLKLQENEKFRHRLFVYISHEFKTPLTVVFGLINRLKQEVKQEKSIKDLEVIERHSILMTNLVNQMNELNELEATDWQPNYSSVDLPEQLRLIIQQIQPLADKLEIKIALQINVESAFQWIDIDKFQVIVNNLLSNAIKYSPKGGVVLLLLKSDAQKWSLIVEDEGPGIDEKEIGHIFEFFYRGSHLHDKELLDSGVGLAYVKAVVKKMGGDITVRSENGAKFEVIFPVKDVLKPIHNIEIGQGIDNVKHFLPSEKTKIGDRILVLLIEDTADVAQYVMSCFSSESYEVIWESNGEKGKNMAIKLVPDIIVLDVRMPGMNGFEVCKHLKNHLATNHIPIIMLTGLVDKESKLQGLQAKVDVYLAKPFLEKELILTVTNLLYTRDQARTQYVEALKTQAQIVTEIPIDTIQNEFVHKTNNILETNYGDPYFGIVEMSSKLFLSRAQLHRKTTAILGQTPSDLLRLYRLEKATQLLKSETYSIAQIALSCGFNDPSYFTKLFKDAYGKTPSAYRK